MKEKRSGWNKKLLQSMLVASVAVPLHLFAFGAGSAIYAEGPSDPAPFIEAKVVNEHAGQKILFDNTTRRRPERPTGLLMALFRFW